MKNLVNDLLIQFLTPIVKFKRLLIDQKARQKDVHDEKNYPKLISFGCASKLFSQL